MKKIGMVLCDTNIFKEIYRGNKLIFEILNKIGQENIAISDVTKAELLFGARNKKELQEIKKDLTHFICLPIYSAISKLAVELVETYTLSHKLALPDAFIAATSINKNYPIYTLNKKDFVFYPMLNYTSNCIQNHLYNSYYCI